MMPRIQLSQSFSGMLWTGGGRVFVRALQFLFGILLARELSPGDFGLVGMLTIFITLAEIFIDCGFTAAFIRKTDRSELDADTVFWTSFVIAFLAYLAVFAAAPVIAGFYRIPELCPIARTLALGFVFGSFAAVPVAWLRVRLAFRMQATLNVIALVGSAAVGIVLACRGLGVWALVWQNLAWSVMWATLVSVAARYRPHWRFSVATFREFFAFGWKHLASSLINAVYENVHFLAIGRVFGAESVGNFTRAESWAHLPSSVAGDALVNVNYPLLAPRQNDAAFLLAAHRRLSLIALALMTPVAAALAFFAEPLVVTVLGSQWAASAAYLRVLAVGVLFQPLALLWLNPLYLRGRTDLVLKLELATKPIAALALVASLPLGLMAVAAVRVAVFALVAVANCVVALTVLVGAKRGER